jgi:glycosyltransferase involved in cell wall biosynthesis
MTAENELVTVCVTTYNRRDLLPLTIKSILSQTYSNFEIIIVDDYSTDGTKVFIEESILNLDKRIKYIRHSNNKGLASARNTAINNARGKYFTFCDDDDVWDKNFISLFVREIKGYNSKYSFCASSISDENTIKAICSSFKDFIVLGYTPPVASQFYFTKSLKEIGGYDENITSGVDHDLWLTLGLKDYKLVWLNQNMVSINQNETESRMTYNIDKRINGIKKSMVIWKSKIQGDFGESFFLFFEKNYQYNTYKKFILFSLKNKTYSNLLFYWQKLPKKLLLLDVKRYLKTRLKIEETLKHPTFTKCIKGLMKNIHKIEIIRE